MAQIKFPKPEQIRLSPEAQRGLVEFMRAFEDASRQIGRQYARVCREMAASAERMREARTS